MRRRDRDRAAKFDKPVAHWQTVTIMLQVTQIVRFLPERGLRFPSRNLGRQAVTVTAPAPQLKLKLALPRQPAAAAEGARAAQAGPGGTDGRPGGRQQDGSARGGSHAFHAAALAGQAYHSAAVLDHESHKAASATSGPGYRHTRTQLRSNIRNITACLPLRTQRARALQVHAAACASVGPLLVTINSESV
jgi:hypothetical protein